MDKLKQWTALTLVGALAIVAVGWFLLVSPTRGEAAALRAQAADQVSANQMLETQIEVLKVKAKELPQEQATLAAVAAKIPENPALPGLVRLLLDASAEAGVQLVSLTPGTPAPVAVPAAAAPAPAADAATVPAPQPDAAAPAAPAAAGPAGQLAAVPVAINVVGGYFEVAQFVAALESLPRALRVHMLSVTPGLAPTSAGEGSADDGSSLTTVINGSVFMAVGSGPAPAAPLAPATK